MYPRVISFVLIFLLCAGLAGYYPVIKFTQWQIRKEVKRRIKNKIPESKLHVIALSTSQTDLLEWEEKGREFIYQGSFYDIVYTDTVNNMIRYHCINDKEEEDLFARLDNLVDDELTSPMHQKAFRILQLCSGLIYLASDQFSFFAFIETIEPVISIWSKYNNEYQKDILHPPQLSA